MDLHPTEIRLTRGRTALAVTWDDGTIAMLPAALLRERARDAQSVWLAVAGLAVPANDDVTITAVEPVGNYAVRLTFSDGHDRGIFPWRHLGEIAAAAAPAAA